MISLENLTRCIDILTELNAKTNNRDAKTLLLEIGYIIKQEIDFVRTTHNSSPRNIDPQKVLADNVQLHKENTQLLDNLNTLKQVIEKKIPSIQHSLENINYKFDVLNSWHQSAC